MLVGFYCVYVAVSHLVIFWSLYGLRVLFGAGAPRREPHMFWPPAIIGAIESLLYPAAIFLQKPEYIGGWIALKVATKWKQWDPAGQGDADGKGRNTWYLFLIGTALGVGLGYFAARIAAPGHIFAPLATSAGAPP